MCTLYWELIVGVILALPFRALFYEIFHIFFSLSLSYFSAYSTSRCFMK